MHNDHDQDHPPPGSARKDAEGPAMFTVPSASDKQKELDKAKGSHTPRAPALNMAQLSAEYSKTHSTPRKEETPRSGKKPSEDLINKLANLGKNNHTPLARKNEPAWDVPATPREKKKESSSSAHHKEQKEEGETPRPVRKSVQKSVPTKEEESSHHSDKAEKAAVRKSALELKPEQAADLVEALHEENKALKAERKSLIAEIEDHQDELDEKHKEVKEARASVKMMKKELEQAQAGNDEAAVFQDSSSEGTPSSYSQPQTRVEAITARAMKKMTAKSRPEKTEEYYLQKIQKVRAKEHSRLKKAQAELEARMYAPVDERAGGCCGAFLSLCGSHGDDGGDVSVR